MALFGFAVNYENGSTDYVIAAGPDVVKAKAAVEEAVPATASVEEYPGADCMIADQYNGVAYLSTEPGF